MTSLTTRTCVPCEGGVTPLSRAGTAELMHKLHAHWRLAADNTDIRRAFSFPDFYHTMSFVNAVAHIANAEDHHPDLEIGYNYCRVRYQTHAINGLHDNDFICAAKIDQLAI